MQLTLGSSGNWRSDSEQEAERQGHAAACASVSCRAYRPAAWSASAGESSGASGQATAAWHDSHRTRSASALAHPRRAHSTALMAPGLANQVAARKVCRRRKRSPRSQGRPAPPGAPSPGSRADTVDRAWRSFRWGR